MNKYVLVDNDVAWKIACYGLTNEFITLWRQRQHYIGVLGAARFVLRTVITKNPKIKNKETASANLEQLLENTEPIEPNDDEIRLAAILEEAAIRSNLPFDIGESILLSALICRSLSFLITGDKRAIAAIERLSYQINSLCAAKGRIICFEQIMQILSKLHSASGLQAAVMKEEDIDTAMNICFRCISKADVTETLDASLQSYIDSIRSTAPTMLANGV